jgi:hypothetical protein
VLITIGRTFTIQSVREKAIGSVRRLWTLPDGGLKKVAQSFARMLSG